MKGSVLLRSPAGEPATMQAATEALRLWLPGWPGAAWPAPRTERAGPCVAPVKEIEQMIAGKIIDLGPRAPVLA